MGEIITINIEINWLLVIGLLLTLIAGSFTTADDRFVLSKRTRFFILSIGCISALFSVFACMTWTPINYDTVFGIQGRYFLPVLPLFMFALRGRNLVFSKQSPSGILVMSSAVISALAALQAFLIVIQR